MGNTAGCCCYRDHRDEDLEPADRHLQAYLASSPPSPAAAASASALPPAAAPRPSGEDSAYGEPAPEPQDSVHQWLLKVAGPSKGSGLAAFAQKVEELTSPRTRRIQSLPRPGTSRKSSRKSSKASFLGRGDPAVPSSAVDGPAFLGEDSAVEPGSSRQWAAAARIGEPEPEEGELGPANWAQLVSVLGDLDAAMAAIGGTGPEEAAGSGSVAAEPGQNSEHSPASSSSAGPQASVAPRSEAEDPDPDSEVVRGRILSFGDTTEDAQSTLLEFSGAEDSNRPSPVKDAADSNRASPVKGDSGTDMAVGGGAAADAPAAAKAAETEAAATWAQERGLSLEGGGLEDMYKYF